MSSLERQMSSLSINQPVSGTVYPTERLHMNAFFGNIKKTIPTHLLKCCIFHALYWASKDLQKSCMLDRNTKFGQTEDETYTMAKKERQKLWKTRQKARLRGGGKREKNKDVFSF